MKGKVEIGNKTVEMKFNGATAVWFNQVFHEDFFVLAEKFAMSKTNGESVDIYSRIAFIGAKQAKSDDLSALSFTDYAKWAGGFEPYDLPNAVDKIAELYDKQTQTTAIPKK